MPRPHPAFPLARVLPAARYAMAAAILLAAPAILRAAEKQPDPEVIRSVEAIRDAFRERRAERMTFLFPAGSKVYLAVRVIAPEASFYSRDQIEALLRQAFATLETVQFDININLQSSGGGGEAPLVLCPAAWSFRVRGTRTDLNLRFLLARQQDHWTLSEIRETR